MESKSKYDGYSEEVLLAARGNPQLAINENIQIAAAKEWAARTAPGVAGGWYEDGSDASSDLNFINSRVNNWKSLIMGCQTYINAQRIDLFGGLEIQEEQAGKVVLGGNLFSATFTIRRLYYDKLTTEEDVLLPVFNEDMGTFVLIVRDGVVMAVIHARTPSMADFEAARKNGTLPHVERTNRVVNPAA